jgi:hypothetical protein
MRSHHRHWIVTTVIVSTFFPGLVQASGSLYYSDGSPFQVSYKSVGIPLLIKKTSVDDIYVEVTNLDTHVSTRLTSVANLSAVNAMGQPEQLVTAMVSGLGPGRIELTVHDGLAFTGTYQNPLLVGPGFFWTFHDPKASLPPSPPAPAIPGTGSTINAVIISSKVHPEDAIQCDRQHPVHLKGGVIALGKAGDGGDSGYHQWPDGLTIEEDPDYLTGKKIPPNTPNIVDVRIRKYRAESEPKSDFGLVH